MGAAEAHRVAGTPLAGADQEEERGAKGREPGQEGGQMGRGVGPGGWERKWAGPKEALGQAQE